MFTTLEPHEKIGEDRRYGLGRDAVENFSHLRVVGNRPHMKNGIQIVGLHLVLHTLLENKKGWVLKTHHSKAAHEAVMQGVIDLSLLAAVANLVKSM